MRAQHTSLLLLVLTHHLASTPHHLLQTVTVGLSLQHGTAAFAAPLELAVANDLEAAADFDALFTVDEAGGLLLRDHVTIRWVGWGFGQCGSKVLLKFCTCRLAAQHSEGDVMHGYQEARALSGMVSRA